MDATATPTLPTNEQASATLDELYGNVFFPALARNGFPVKTAEDAKIMIDLAAQTRVAAEDPRIKSASTSPYAGAANDLNTVMQANGIGAAQAQQASDISIKQAAAQAAAAPMLYNSVLVARAAQAQAMAQTA